MITGFGAALLPYGPIGLGVPSRTLAGTTNPLPPTGVSFGNATELFASGLLLNDTGMGAWQWINSTGAFSGPCNGSGVYNGTGYQPANNKTDQYNLNPSFPDNLVCLNSVMGGQLNASWYYNPVTDAKIINDSYYSVNGVANGSYYNNSIENITSCNAWGFGPGASDAWNLTHIVNASFTPCDTYYEQNSNTTYVLSFAGSYAPGPANYSNNIGYDWASNQMGYLPNDVVYEVPVIFGNASVNGTYEISIAIGGVTPVAQTFFFNNTLGGMGNNTTIYFTFDMTAAWLMDLSFNMTGMPATQQAIYGAIGTVSTIVTECSPVGCPI